MKKLKSVLKAIDVAFSMYSKIPMPKFTWNSQDMKYHLIFFPWVGAVIGALEWGWFMLWDKLSLDKNLFYIFALVIPFLVTGGFHADGFMDTMDALHSYQSRERKLEILKDPHIGAFSVICLSVYLLMALGFVFSVNRSEGSLALCFSFFISRCLSGISVCAFPKAKSEGMVHTESETGSKKTVLIFLILQLILSVSLMIYVCFGKGYSAYFCAGIFPPAFLYFYLMSKKQFGGITGDLCGFFVCISELMSLISVSICCMIFK